MMAAVYGAVMRWEPRVRWQWRYHRGGVGGGNLGIY